MPVETVEMLTPALPRGVTVEQASQWPDTAEAARRLNVSKRTVLRRYRAYRIAGQRRYDPRDLAADVVQVGYGVPGAGSPRTPAFGAAVLREQRRLGVVQLSVPLLLWVAKQLGYRKVEEPRPVRPYAEERR